MNIPGKKLAVLSALMMTLSLAACGGSGSQSGANASGAEGAANTEASVKTLDKIKKSGTIVLAYRDSSVPFSYIADQAGQPVGYAVEIQQKVVEAVKKQLNMPDLKVRFNLVTSQNRIPLLVNGTVDLECGSTTNNPERAKQVDFSNAFFEIGTRLMVPKGSDIKDFTDLKGKTLVTTAGTTSERMIKEYNQKNNLGMNIISAKDHGESFLMLENGRAQAFMMDDVLLAGERAKSAEPAKWEIVGKPMSFERYGCMVRKGDADFKKIVDGTIEETYKSGDINGLYKKWFESPIPPKNINLNFPMSDQLKDIIAHPTDKPADKPAS